MDKDLHILPHILATLSLKPDRSDYIEDFCDEVEDIVAAKYPDARVTHIRKAIKKALKDAQDLGIISIASEEIRMPFTLNGIQSPVIDDAVDEIMDDSMDDEDNATNRTSRRKSSSPRKRAPLMAPRTNGRRRSARARRPRRGRASSRGRVSRRRDSRRR